MVFGPNNRKALALIVLVLVLGVALGAVGHSLFDRRVQGARTQTQLQPRPNPPRGVARLTTELNLAPDQQKQLSTILMDMQQRFDDVRRQVNPQFDQIREQGHDQIRQILTPEQRPKFEDFLNRLTEERRRRGPNPNR
jgi:hypothetical protein